MKKIASVLLLVLIALPAYGLTVLQLNVEQLAALSEKIFVGKCLSVRSIKDRDGRPVQEVTFEVSEMIKGDKADRVVFRQIGESVIEERGGLAVQGVARDLPRYEVGEEAVVFLSAEGGLGLTAPVGLQQGKFSVMTGNDGEKQVVNGMGNRGLFLGWKKSPRFKAMTLTTDERKLLIGAASPLPYNEFVSLVKKLVRP